MSGMVCSIYARSNNITMASIVLGGGGEVKEPSIRYVCVGSCLINKICAYIVGRGC